jgi:predicted DCC family thiol-disulfide oxidoreductase YuxK
MRNHPIIFFDGVCNLCNSTLNFIIRRDKKKIFRFAALQSESAKIILQKSEFKNEQLDTIVLLFGNQVFIRSDAVIEIFRLLGFPLNLFALAKIIPRKIRDSIYDFISSHRYGWFGMREDCMIPDENIKSRFL